MKSLAWYEKLKPENWSWQWIVGVLGFLLCLNLFGPKGLLHLVLLEQHHTRLLEDSRLLTEQIQNTETEIRIFEENAQKQKLILRDRMGYLRAHEYRVEFFSETTPHNL
jgi:uncharacterized protein YdcH (DUF465 family)